MVETNAEWWRDYFDDVFLRVYRAVLTPERTAVEIDGVIQLLDPPPGARVLDVGCGWGRHAIELARLGMEVTGFDHSAFLLAEAERAGHAAGVEVRWSQGDMRALPFREEFDAAVSLFSSLGYFGSDDDDVRVLRGMRDAVRPGGLLLLDTMHRDLIAREFAERDWWSVPEGGVVRVEREFDAVEGSSREVLHWRGPDGVERTKAHSIRIRTATEWGRLLEGAGWEAAEWLGDWDLEPFTLASPRLIVLARRPAGGR